MYDLIQERLKQIKTREEKLNQLRELLQIIILRIMHETNQFQYMAFVGGTCLRILYKLNRFSEGLDFSLIHKSYKFSSFVKALESNLKKSGFFVEFKVKDEKNVISVLVKFSDVLHYFNLTGLKNQKLNIRIKIDSNPPSGWRQEVGIISDLFVFPITHHDLPSLFATKLHACFFRKYQKGRDYYDLMWYLSKKIVPNFELLNNAIRQTQKKRFAMNPDTFIPFLEKHLATVDLLKMQKDVSTFLKHDHERDLISIEIFKSLMDKYKLDNSNF